jgi:hypothetical protein
VNENESAQLREAIEAREAREAREGIINNPLAESSKVVPLAESSKDSRVDNMGAGAGMGVVIFQCSLVHKTIPELSTVKMDKSMNLNQA